ncbi:MAG: ATP-binding cassette domain-containing protein [Candidatus Eisenbacteria bacterium]|nr:ATP-binding cassette domain-containing protein [Candidatus Eisenbacteria bacterium]
MTAARSAASRYTAAGGGGAGRAPGSGDQLLGVERLTARYGRRIVFREVSFALSPGSLTALIGPNGCGKTTLLHALAGIHAELSGRIELDGRPLASFSRREVARRVALVPQFSRVDFDVPVAEAVATGRYPWLAPLQRFGPRDREAVAGATAAMDLEALRDRPIHTLSGGERQRVFLARALAQETPILLLDEPAASLDLRYQQETYARLIELARSREVAILVTDHHLNLVAATCERLLVLHEGRLWDDGPPREIISREMIQSVFGARMQIRSGAREVPQCVWDF